jgi:hypothetical protein
MDCIKTDINGNFKETEMNTGTRRKKWTVGAKSWH